MHKTLLALSLLLPLTASAANTVTFLGEVSDTTCNVTVNGSSGDLAVQLPTVTTTDLGNANDFAGEKEFIFTVSGCTGSTQNNVGMRLVAPIVDSNLGGNLANIAAANPATNVAIQILDNATIIDFLSGEYHSTTQPLGSSLVFPFTARYVATASGVTPGAVEAKLEYALSYN